MNPKTEACMKSMIEFAREGNEIYPALFTPCHGRATVSAAVRCAVKRGLLVSAGLDGIGQNKWKAPAPVATHTAPATVQ
tara:strand:- start:132 stop:368 length:237 start_codon:yes stop_codon:yes gene_type:complete